MLDQNDWRRSLAEGDKIKYEVDSLIYKDGTIAEIEYSDDEISAYFLMTNGDEFETLLKRIERPSSYEEA